MPITHKATLPLCRPREPSFMQKMNCRFDIPADHLVFRTQIILQKNRKILWKILICFFFSFQPPRYKEIGVEILERFNDENENVQKLSVKPITYPNLDFLKTFDKNCKFSPFVPLHMKYANALMKIFDTAKDLDELISLALYCRDQVNSQLFIYAYTVVLTHRYDSDNIELPQLFEIAPDRFFKKKILASVQEKLHACNEAKRNRRDANKNTDYDKVFEMLFGNLCFV